MAATRIRSAQAGQEIVTLTDGATISVDAAKGHNFRVTLTASGHTLANPTGAYDGQHLTFEIVQDGTGGWSISLGTKFAFGADITAYSNTTTASKRDFITVRYNSSADKFYVVGVSKGY
jgi:hypothetical protein